MRFIVYILIALSVLCAACGDSLDSTLERAEALVDNHPDSAYALLAETSWPSIRSESRRARYGLIATQALTSLYEKPESDSMIAAALAYYDRAGVNDPVRLAKALYYSSIAKDDAGHDAQAIAYAMRARDIAAEQNLPFWEAKSWREISYLYSQSFDYYHAIDAAEKAVDLFKSINSTRYYQHSVIEYILLHTAYGKSQEGLAIYDSLWLREKPLDQEMADYARFVRSEQLLHAERPEAALACLDSISASSSYLDTSAVYDYAQYLTVRIPILVKLGRTVEARRLIDRLKAAEGLDNFELSGILSGYYKEIGKLDSALAFQGQHTERLYDNIRQSMANSALSAGVDYYKEQYRNKAREQQENRNRTITIIVFVSALVLAVGVGGWRKMRRQAREIARRKDEIALLSEDAENTYRRMAALEESLAGMPGQHAEIERFVSLYKEQYQNLDRLISSGAYSASIVGDTHFQDFYTTTREIFTPQNILIIEEEINREYRGIVSEMAESCPGVSEEMRLIMDLVIFGIGSKTIAIIFGKTPSNIYTSLSRTRNAIMKSGWTRAEEFCALIKRR